MELQTSTTRVCPVWDTSLYRQAGPTDLIELRPVPGANPLFLEKRVIETLTYALAAHEICHISGHTGSAKTSLIEALALIPDNFLLICEALELPQKPVKLYPIEMVTFETPGELYQRRALKDGTTYDEPSRLVVALRDAERVGDEFAPVVWLREIGRVHSSSVQGGLLNLMSRTDIVLPDGTTIDGRGIAWVADSNYQAERDAVHTLVTLDKALQRRFTINLTLDYLAPEQEVQVLLHLAARAGLKPVEEVLAMQVVKLGQVVRRHQEEGNLPSLVPPTLSGYLSLIRMMQTMSHMSLQQIASVTLLGIASREDQRLLPGIFNEAFGRQTIEQDDFTMGGPLF